MQWYAYMWLREDGTPYYIGKGKKNRAFVSDKHTVRRPADNSRILVFERNSDRSVSEKTRQAVAATNKIYKHALGYKWEQVSSPKQLSDWGNRGHHIRWHLNRNIVSSSCEFCNVNS